MSVEGGKKCRNQLDCPRAEILEREKNWFSKSLHIMITQMWKWSDILYFLLVTWNALPRKQAGSAWGLLRKVHVWWALRWIQVGGPHKIWSPPRCGTQDCFWLASVPDAELQMEGKENSGGFKYIWGAVKMEVWGWHGNLLFTCLNYALPMWHLIFLSSATWMFTDRDYQSQQGAWNPAGAC